jgi:hypothetical protein
MKAEILKPMTVGDSSLFYGDIVDVSGWRNIKSLANSRYIRIIEEEEIKPVKAEVKPKAKKAVASK